MKEIEKKRTYKTTEYVKNMICDICGQKNKGGDDWSEGGHDVLNTTVRMEEGDSYPEGMFGETTSFDICADCFQEKLIPWLKSLGAKPEIKEWD